MGGQGGGHEGVISYYQLVEKYFNNFTTEKALLICTSEMPVLATNSFLLHATWIADMTAGAQESIMDLEVEAFLRMTKQQDKSLDAW